jgi:hypothetical protein
MHTNQTRKLHSRAHLHTRIHIHIHTRTHTCMQLPYDSDKRIGALGYGALLPNSVNNQPSFCFALNGNAQNPEVEGVQVRNMYMYVCMYVCIWNRGKRAGKHVLYVCIFMCVYICMYVRTYLCVFVCMCVYVCIEKRSKNKAGFRIILRMCP